MKLNLNKPLVVFDLETTGLDLVKDRIIQISYIKLFPDGKEERVNQFINPECVIPNEVVALTGITNEDVKGQPTFKELAPQQPSPTAILQDSILIISMCRYWQKSFFAPVLTSISPNAAW